MQEPTNVIEQTNTNSQPILVTAEVHGAENPPSPSLNATDTVVRFNAIFNV